MKKYIFNQGLDIIRNVDDCLPIQRIGNMIYGIGYSLEDNVLESEDVANKGMKKHLIELGIYDTEDRANMVMVFLVRWLRNLEGGSVFIMPEYAAKVDLIEELGHITE